MGMATGAETRAGYPVWTFIFICLYSFIPNNSAFATEIKRGEHKQDRQCTYDVMLRGVCALLRWKGNEYRILSECLKSYVSITNENQSTGNRIVPCGLVNR